MPVERAGFVTGNVKLRVFLIDPFIAIHTILFRIVIHGVVPPIKQGVGLRPVYWIPVVAPGIFMNQPAGNIIDMAVTMERVQHQEKPGFMIVDLVNSRREVGFERKDFFRPSTGHRE